MKIDINNRYEIGDLVIIRDLNYYHNDPAVSCKIGVVSSVIVESSLRCANQPNLTDDMFGATIRYRVNTGVTDETVFAERSTMVNEDAILGKVDDITPEMMTKLRSLFTRRKEIDHRDTSC